MIITCAKCATQFQLDEARVPEAGIRVRCSVCKNAFFVEHPDGLDEASDALTEAVEAALAAEGQAVPEPSHDLEGLADPVAPAAGSREEGSEGSWEFSDGGRLSEAVGRETRDRFEESFDAAREAVDALLGGPDAEPPWSSPGGEPARRLPEPAAADEGLGLPEAPALAESLRASEEPPEAPEPLEVPGLPDLPGPPDAPEPDPGDASAEVPLAEDPWEIPAWTDHDARTGASDFDSELAPDLDTGDGENLEIAGDGDPSSAALEAGPDPFEDELAGDEPPLAGEAPPGWDREDEVEVERLEPEPHALAAAPRSAATSADPLSPGLDAPLELEPRRSRALAWLARFSNGVGSGVVALLAAVALWGSVAPRVAPGAGAGTQPLAGLEATGVAGRWVEHAVLGPLYVVSGELHNAGSEPKAPGSRLVVRLLDAEGVPVEAAAASLAPPLGARWLREADPGELRAARELGARQLAQTALAPGARVAFEAVVEALPDAARRFDLAAAPSG